MKALASLFHRSNTIQQEIEDSSALVGGDAAARERLMFGATAELKNLFVEYNTAAYDGHDDETTEVMRERYGANVLAHADHLSALKQFTEAFVNPFTIVLFILAIISFVTDYVLAEPGDGDLTAVIIIVSMVTISGLLRFVQESRSGKAAEALVEMVETTTAVVRNSDVTELPIDEVVVGDIIQLAAGDMVPADMRILEAKDLFVSESSLTGESEPVEKFGHIYDGISTNPLDTDNLAFMGSDVVSGSATAIVLAVGNDTFFGQVAQAVAGKDSETSFEKGVNSVSWVLIRFMLVMVPVVFLLTGLTKGNWMGALLFALSIAVGMTPEMLPMIVSANLAKGAVAMSKKRVIVKNLNSIQNFGGMDILCTDKTGTLTEDRIILEYSLDVMGNEDKRVLRHGFLNSYFQTGLRNLLDEAIINHAEDAEMVGLRERYQKVDEIPFDFMRRRMSVVVEDDTGKRQMITKGAIEEMLSVSTFVEYEGRVEPLTDILKQKVLDTVSIYNAQGMRVLGISQRSGTNLPEVGEFAVSDENDMVLIGYLAFLDPPKESTRAAVDALHDYDVDIKVLTGDNDAVTRKVCHDVGIKVSGLLNGSDIEQMTDAQLDGAVHGTDVFAKLSPQQKVRIVASLRRLGHTVGFMGDGINDAAAMKEADVGISVDTAVDIAKESANIILLEKDLMVLEEGVIEGRKVYGNTIKYIKMTASSNFGNMFSVLFASAFLPFLPMLPLQILTLNLIYDISCTSMPWDNVDDEFLRKARGWDAGSISRFMVWFGPTSSVFDIATYLVMLFIIGPAVFGGSFWSLSASNQAGFIALFHTAWFVVSLWTQTLVLHALRTPRVPFVHSRASWPVIMLTVAGITVGTVLPFTVLGKAIGLAALPWEFSVLLVTVCVLYIALVTAVKKIFVRKYGELL